MNSYKCPMFSIDMNSPLGSFTNYVHKFLAFFDHVSSFVDSFYLTKVDIFGPLTYLTLLVNVVCERPLMIIQHEGHDRK
jgi:hypothetical protein